MHRRSLVAFALPVVLVSAFAASGLAAPSDQDARGRFALRAETDLPSLVCKGFWDGGACDAGDPIEVSGNADTDVLALFPNNAPERFPTIVETTD